MILSAVVTVHEKVVRFIGSLGTVRLDIETLQIEFISNDGSKEVLSNGEDFQVIPEGIEKTAFAAGTVYMGRILQEFFEANGVSEDFAQVSTFEDGLIVQRVLDSARVSDREHGRWIEL